MTKEEKQLLLIDLCARLPHEVQVFVEHDKYARATLLGVNAKKFSIIFGGNNWSNVSNIEGNHIEQYKQLVKPYLRPMKTMTEKDVQEIRDRLNNLSIGRTITEKNFEKCCDFLWFTKMSIFECVSEKMMEVVIGYLDENMFDHRGLIPKGLALEATEGMYNI